MPRIPPKHLVVALAVAVFCGGLAVLGVVAQAQTVMGSGSPANCIQNAGNLEFACGSGSTAAPGTGVTAVGVNAKATADAASAFGASASAGAIAAIAIGQNANASQQGSVAIGQGATSSGSMSTAIGFAGRAFGNDSVAVGDTATASSNFSTALGANAQAGFASSTALGFGAQATAENQMMFGTATNIYALPGVNSAASKKAQKGPVQMLTVDASGNVATAPVPTCRCAPIRKR
jgi:hypothetical protein